MRQLSGLVSVLAAISVAACGGVEESSLFGGAGSPDAASLPVSHDASTSADAAHPIATAEAGTLTTHEASTLPDVLTVEEPSVMEKPEAAPPTSGKMLSIACPTGGKNVCTGPAPIACCVQQNIVVLMAAATCESPADPAACKGNGEALVTCTSSHDCDHGEVCCGSAKNSQDQYTSVRCEAACTSGEMQFCTGSASDCGSGNACVPSTVLPPYDVCLN
jgi:hypothetical protein